MRADRHAGCHRGAGVAAELRPYQIEAVRKLRAEYATGKRAIVVVSPTGSGKTVFGTYVAAQHVAKGGRVLWTAHRRELIDQAEAAFKAWGVACERIATGARAVPAPVKLMSVQTLLARDPSTWPDVTMLIKDEAHHAPSEEWSRPPRHYRDRGALLIGLTATPERGDGTGLGEVFDGLIEMASIRELTSDGYLVPCEIFAPNPPLRAGEIAQIPADAYLECARGTKAICFSPNIKSAEQHVEEFQHAGVAAALVTGTTGSDDRARLFASHKAGTLRVLVNVGVATEGYDDPSVETIILARGCGSAGLYLQMVGRGLRPAAGKTSCKLIDLRGVSHVHGSPDAEREYSLDGRAIRLAGEALTRLCPVCSAPMQPDAVVCGSCGRESEGPKVPVVVHAKLHKFAAIRRDDHASRVQRIARWIAAATAAGRKPGSAWHKARAVYGEVDRDTWREALMTAQAHERRNDPDAPNQGGDL